MIDDLATFKSTFAAIPLVANSSWAQNFADWVDARVTNKMGLTGIGGPGLTFTFDKSTFQTQLLALTPTDNALAGITAFADAWQAAMATSIAVVAPLSYIGVDTPATKWSVVSSSIIDIASITVAKAKIVELKDSMPAEIAEDSDFPVKFREAFLSLTITTSGLNSVTPTPGPLIDPARAIV